jgi:hypothetical protein
MTSVLLSAVVALQLWSASAPEVPTVYVVAYDASASVPAAEFAAYPDMVRGAVLELVRPGDTIVFLRMDRPNDPPETTTFDSRFSRLRMGVVSLYEQLRALKQSGPRHGTDHGLALDHVRRRIELDRRLASKVTPRYVLVAVTDGVADGKQTPVSAPSAGWTAGLDWRLVFLGVRSDVESGVRTSATRCGFNDPQRVLFLPFSHWQQLRANLSQFIGRTPNTALVSALDRSARSADVSRR